MFKIQRLKLLDVFYRILQWKLASFTHKTHCSLRFVVTIHHRFLSRLPNPLPARHRCWVRDPAATVSLFPAIIVPTSATIISASTSSDPHKLQPPQPSH
ncbi:hypothetical protein Hdeb2414_s0015g00451761 [Helianthus debilis subsp. tardiflorus]